MIDVVIIGHNEGESVEEMMRSITPKYHVIYVADRCTDDTIKRISQYKNVTIVDTTPLGLVGRQTSFCRNLGLHFTSPKNDVLFLDGDRFITDGWVDSLKDQSSDIILLLLEEDYRRHPQFNIQDQYGTFYNGFFSCGVFFKRSAINTITKHSSLYRVDGIQQLFPEDLQSEWGIEDTSLGDICYDCGLSVDLSQSITLHGRFEKEYVDDIDTIAKRLVFRKRLKNVKW